MNDSVIKTSTQSRKFLNMALLVGCLTVSCLVLTVNAEPLLPAIPCEFYGNVSINGWGAPSSTTITAFINGEQRGIITTTIQGRYGGSLGFDQRLGVTGTENDRGLPVTFRVNGVVTNESSFFHDGHSNRQDLNVFITGSKPTARFTTNISIGLAPITVKFTDISDCLDPTSRLWTFGDGNISSAQEPVYIFRHAGNYSATLTITNNSGSNTTVPGQSITVYPKGDFNHNWVVDTGDVALVAYMGVNRTPSQIPDADFNNNGFVDIGDAAKIAWFKVGKITEL